MRPNDQLSIMPSLDLKTLIEGTCILYSADNDQSLTMAVKFGARTAYCFTNSFPVLRLSPSLRELMYQTMTKHKPKGLLYKICWM